MRVHCCTFNADPNDPQEKHVLQLILDPELTGRPVQPVRWVVTPDFFAELEKRRAEQPQLLLVTCRLDKKVGHTDEEHRLYDLRQGMTHVEFDQPGDYRIFAAVVWEDPEASRSLAEAYLRCYGGRYDTSLIDGRASQLIRAEELVGHGRVFNNRLGEATMDIEVQRQEFAQEPAAWKKWYANLWHRYPARDQCQMRNRLWVLGLLKLVPVIVYAVFMVVMTLAGTIIMVGMTYNPRRIRWRMIFHPFEVKLENLFRDDTETLEFIVPELIERIAGENLVRASYAVMPSALLLYIGFISFIVMGLGDWVFTDTIENYHATTFIGLLLGALIFLGVLTLPPYQEKRRERQRERAAHASASALTSPRYWFTDPSATQHLVRQEGRTLRLRVSDLPRDVRSFALWLRERKTNVCRPFVH